MYLLCEQAGVMDGKTLFCPSHTVCCHWLSNTCEVWVLSEFCKKINTSLKRAIHLTGKHHDDTEITVHIGATS